MIWYLCGGINGLTDADAKDWREYVKERLGAGNCLDPMRRDYRGREDVNAGEIVAGDLVDIDASDALIVNASRPSWGTAMEVFYAYRKGRVVLTVIPEEPIDRVKIVGLTVGSRVSPWLRYHSTSICLTLDEALQLALALATQETT